MKNLIADTISGKISVFICTIVLATISTLNAQLPQGFKYQTVVRNNAGLGIGNESINFRLSILAGSSTGTPVYVETQTTNSTPQGVVTLMVGDGTPESGSFDQIDWSAGNFYLQIEIEVFGASSWTLMGTSQLVSVPYALYAQSSGAGQWSGDSKSIYYNGRVGIGGQVVQDTSLSDTILFEVKDRNGSPVFRVQESGVRVFVESGSKGARGGFIVGGKKNTKGDGSDLMMITNDSIRLYVDDQGTKGSKGGFAVGGRSGSKGSAVNFIHLTPDNSFIGKESGFNNETGVDNVFLGNQSGYSNIDGEYNIFLGAVAGYANISGYDNIFLGNSSGSDNENGYFNVFIGNYSGSSNIDGYSNIYVGDQSGGMNAEGNQNVYIGDYSGANDTAGTDNVFIGAFTGSNSTDAGYHNIFIGSNTGISIDHGTYNNFLGTNAGYYISSGNYNNFMGDETGYNTTTGSGNLFLGDWAGRDNEDGDNNVYVGRQAGLLNVSGTGNVFLGHNAGYFESGSNRLYISNDESDYSSALIYGEFDNQYLQVNAAMYLNGDGTGVWTAPSDARLKKNIVNLPGTLEKTLLLRPVSYDWKDPAQSKSHGKQLGLIAQEVEELFPEIVRTDRNGMKSMDYSRLSVILIQAFKEQQQIMLNQKTKIDQQDLLATRQQANLEELQKSIENLREENNKMKLQLSEIEKLKIDMEKLKASISNPVK